MRTVFEAGDTLEAHMVCDLLKQQGIAAQVLGEHLQGAVGELPAGGFIRVVVDEADFTRARAIVEEWDAQQPEYLDDGPGYDDYYERLALQRDPAARGGRARGRPWRSRPWWQLLSGLLAGLAIGAAAMAFHFREPQARGSFDHDGDGTPDETAVYAQSGALLATEQDRNHDGRVDLKVQMDDRGAPRTAESDDDFDGRFETRSWWRAGSVEQTDTDTDGDGETDLRLRYTHGVQTSVEYLDPASALPLRIEHYRLGKLASAEVDSDRDGELDRRISYTADGEVAGTVMLPE